MPTLEFTLAAVPIRLTSNSSELTDLLAAYFHYYQPRLADEAQAAEQTAIPLSLTLDFCETLPARQTWLTPHAALFSHTGAIRLWRDAAPVQDGITSTDVITAADRVSNLNASAGASQSQISNLKSQISNLKSRSVLADAPSLPNEVFFFELGEAAFFVEPVAGRATGCLTPAALAYPRSVANTYALLPLLLLLRARNVYHLHAAAVLTPGGKLCVFPAAPRAGKTTLATALGLAGWQPVSDDSLLLEAGHKRPSLTPLRKEFHLDEGLLACWPALARVEVRHRYLGRACVAALEFFGTVELAASQYRQIDYVILPQLSGDRQSRLEPLPASEALLKLAEQSMFLQLWRDHTARHFAALAALIQSAATYRLWCGTDMLEDPRAAATVLRTL